MSANGIVSLKDAVEITVAAKRQAGLRAKYVKGLEQYLKLFIRGRENFPVAKISPRIISDWFDQRQEKPATRASNIGRLKALFRHCWQMELIDINPCDRIPRVTIERECPKILTVTQARTLLEAMYKFGPPGGLAYVSLGLLAGLRPYEAQRIRPEAIDTTKGIITIDASISKVRRRRIVHLLPSATAWLKVARLETLPLTFTRMRRILMFSCGVLGMTSWTQDLMRHSCASYWLAHVQDSGKVAHQLGNSAGILLRHYRELVTREDAAEFWSIRPPGDGKQLTLKF